MYYVLYTLCTLYVIWLLSGCWTHHTSYYTMYYTMHYANNVLRYALLSFGCCLAAVWLMSGCCLAVVWLLMAAVLLQCVLLCTMLNIMLQQ